MVESSFIPTSVVLDGLDEEWLTNPEASRYRSWYLRHVHGRSNICIMTMNTAEFQGTPPENQVGSLPFDLTSSFIDIAYSLRHEYDFMRVHLPSPDLQWLQRVLPWYKVPILRYLVQLRYAFVMYIDADAYFQQQELPLPSAIPSFFANPDKILFASKDPVFSVFNAGVMLFRPQHSAFLPLLQQWWEAPQKYEADGVYQKVCHAWTFPAEQGCLDALYNASDSAQLMEVGQEQWIYGDNQAISTTFVRHYAGFSHDARLQATNMQAAKDFADLIHKEIKALQHG